MAAKTKDENYGTFERDGRTRVADSPGLAVELRFRGWAEKKPATAPTSIEATDPKKS